MESQNKLVIISRYQENLDWVKKLDSNIVIYNKDEHDYHEFPNYKVPNYGRESETFLRAIIDHYNQLSNFDSVTFLQGDPFDHCPDLFEKLSEEVESYNYLSNNIQEYDLMSDLYINGTHLSLINNMYGIPLNWQIIIDVKGNDLNFSKIFEQIFAVCQVMKIDYKGKKYKWGHGAQYTVKSELILSKPLDWWKSLYRLLNYNYTKINNPSFGYAMEKIWPLIWEHTA